jgi:TolA-binding protein
MYVAAAGEYLRFAERYPHSTYRPRAMMGAGEAFMQAGKASRALDAFGLYLETFPDGERACEARYQRGRILHALRRYGEAADELLMVPENHPECRYAGRAMLDAGEALIAGGDFEGAARLLRRLISDRRYDDLKPRAMYSLSLALEQIGRDLEARSVLEELVAGYSSSPVTALALLRLGEGALKRGDHEGALNSFTLVSDRFKENSLRERSSLGIIEVYRANGDDEELLQQSRRYLERFDESPRRGWVYREAIHAAWRLGEYERTLELISDFEREGVAPDSTGELTLLAARVLQEKGKTEEAFTKLSDFRHRYPASPLLGEALVVEADLCARRGEPAEALRLYHHALLEGGERVPILSALAALAAGSLGDTLTAIRYWDQVAVEDRGGEAAEEAIWKSSRARERTGDLDGAAAGYTELVSTYYGGRYAGEAKGRLESLALRTRWTDETARRLARVAASSEPLSVRYLEAGVILMDEAGDAAGALPYLEGALAGDLPDSLRAKAGYYVGAAHLRKYQYTRTVGEGDGSERNGALAAWLDTARDFPGNAWGRRSHRSYIEERLADWEPGECLKRLDEFTRYYGNDSAGWWALGAKVDILYGLAQRGTGWAADSALAVCGELLSSGASREEKREAALKAGYLYRMRGAHAEAAASLKRFTDSYGDDPRATPVLYDLGESLLLVKEYERAFNAYVACIERKPQRQLMKKCMLRLGDCHYYQHRFEEAAASYGAFTAQWDGDDLAFEAAYRRALAFEALGEREKANDILYRLLAQSLPTSLRVKVIRKLGASYVADGRYGEAEPLLTELVSMEQSAQNLVLLAEAMLGVRRFEDAARRFGDALKTAGVDTCRALAGRARASYRMDETDKGGRDFERLLARCPDNTRAAAVLLDRGITEVGRNACGEAEATLGELRERYAGRAEAADALYYLALCDMKRGGYHEAQAKLEAYLTEAPNAALADDAYFKLASASYGAGDLNLAARYYALSAEATDDRELAFMALSNRGRIFQELEDWEEAAAAWQQVVEQFPERDGIVEVLFDLGFSYGQAGRYEMAYEVYRRVPALAASEEQQGRAHYWAGISLKNLGNYEEAIREFLRVPYLRTGGMWGVTSKLEAAACYRLAGDVEQAKKIYRDVIASHGANSDWGKIAAESLEQLERAADDAGGGSGGGPPVGGEERLDGP